MGIGRLAGNRFNMVLSIRHNADTARLDQWRASYEQASRLLFDATDGQHQLGDIYVCNDSFGGRNADAWLHEEDGRSSAGGLAVIGNETIHQTLYGDERFKPFILVHEWAHYAYGVADEYSGPSGTAECTGDSTADVCIMESGWWDGDRFGNDATGGALVSGRVSEFCVASNHDPDNDSYQESINGVSCWETMVGEVPALTAPAGLPTGADPGGSAPVNWVVLAPERRFVLVVDRSGSMAGEKLTEAKFGADWWADASVVGDRLGVVSYSDTVSTDYGLQSIDDDADRANAQGAIAGISAGGMTSIGGGLRRALDQILATGPRAAEQVVVLLTDGLHNSGENPSAVLPDLRANGVRVYTIGIGPDIDSPLLLNIASTTGGTFYRIDPTLTASGRQTAIRNALIEISGIARDNGGIVTTFPERPNEKEHVERRVLIEHGSERATFALSWPSRQSRWDLALESPSGRTIDLGTADADVRAIANENPYCGLQVERPEPGVWTVIARAGGATADGFRMFVFSDNPHIDGGLFSPRRRYRLGARIPLKLQVYFGQPITGLHVKGSVVLPGGARIPLEFTDDADPDRGDDIAADGLYGALFTKTKLTGAYTVEAVVVSDAHSVSYPEEGELLRDDERYEYPPIPEFTRVFKLTFMVGRERRRPNPDPDRLKK